jgi:hypothetical protein
LDEAIQFHDFTSAQIKKGGDFPGFEADVLARALPSLRWGIHDAALAHLRKLLKSIRQEITNDQFQALLLEVLSPVAAKGKKDLLAEWRPRAVVRALISPGFRDPARSRLLAQGKGKVLIRRLEDLERGADGLHSFIERGVVESALTASFGPDLTTPWGGTRSVALDGRLSDPTPAGGYANAGRADVGLTEKLYEQFSADVFKRAHTVKSLTSREIPATVAGGPPFRLHLEIRDAIRALFRETLLGEWKGVNDLPPPFGLWHRNLEALESRFLHACVQGDMSPLATGAGLPWALVLTGTLRVYLADLVARMLMVSLPTRIGWDEVTGYLGVALWEAHTGRDAPHPTRLGYLVPRALADTELRQAAPGSSPPAPAPAPDPLLTALESWRTAPFRSFLQTWGQVLVHQQRLSPLFTEMVNAPHLVERPDPKAKNPSRQPATADELMTSWPRYPVCRYPGVHGTERGAELRSGAYLSAQLQLFVADQILRVALDDLGMPQPDPKRQDRGTAAELKVRQRGKPRSGFTDAVGVFAGSLHWAGRHPPHITHRDGATFDLVFGARTVAWLSVDDSKGLNEAIRKAGLGTRGRPYSDLEGVCLTLAQQTSQTPVASIFRSLMREHIRAELKPILDAMSRLPGSSERSLHTNAEGRLGGTPHFATTAASQQVQVAYTALLLSCPTQVIFSSPIAHLRAIRAIRFGLTGVGDATVRLAGEALRAATFIFKPEDHWNHWHLQYSVPGGGGQDPEPATARVARFLPLWAKLGVDLDPFASYLQSLVISPNQEPQVKRASDERDLLLDLLRTYAPAASGRDRVRDLFQRFSSGDPDGLLKPAIATKLSTPLQALADESQGIVVKVKTRKLVIRFLEAIDELQMILTGDPDAESPE